MKIKTTLLLMTISLLFQNVFAQNNTVKIECILEINQTEWLNTSQITANLSIKNLSAEKVKLKLSPRFDLESLEFKNPIGEAREYGSAEINYLTLEDNKITEINGNGAPQSFEFSLESGESKTVEFDISRLGWLDHFSSVSSFRSWQSVIPSGNYNLYYNEDNYLDERDKSKGWFTIVSNKVCVNLKNRK